MIVAVTNQPLSYYIGDQQYSLNEGAVVMIEQHPDGQHVMACASDLDAPEEVIFEHILENETAGIEIDMETIEGCERPPLMMKFTLGEVRTVCVQQYALTDGLAGRMRERVVAEVKKHVVATDSPSDAEAETAPEDKKDDPAPYMQQVANGVTTGVVL